AGRHRRPLGSLHRRLGAHALWQAGRARPRVPARPRRPGRHRGRRDRTRRGGCRLRRRLRGRLHAARLPVLPGAAFHPGVALQAADPVRERLRHRQRRHPRRAGFPGRQARPLCPGARRREDDGHAGCQGGRTPALGQLPQDRARHPGRLRWRLRPHRRDLLPAARRPVRRARRHRRQEPRQRGGQPLGANAEGPRLRVLPPRKREEPLRRPTAQAHRLLPGVGRRRRAGHHRRRDGPRHGQSGPLPRRGAGERLPAHSLPRDHPLRRPAGGLEARSRPSGPQNRYRPLLRRDARLLHHRRADRVRGDGLGAGRAGRPRRDGGLDRQGRPLAGEPLRRPEEQGPPDRRHRRLHARADRHATHRHGGCDATAQGRPGRRVQHGRRRRGELRLHPRTREL
ncbi:MAG: 3-ketoacyl-CoA thiolase, partial [uncultured Acetobacteraceae bacterium]